MPSVVTGGAEIALGGLDTPTPDPHLVERGDRHGAEGRVHRRVQRAGRDRLLLGPEQGHAHEHRDDDHDRRGRRDRDGQPTAAFGRLLLRPELVEAGVAGPRALRHGATVTGPAVGGQWVGR